MLFNCTDCVFLASKGFMRAFEKSSDVAEPGLVDRSLDPPKAGEVQVRIAACGLNFADLLMAEGRYQDTPQTPFTLGMELAGVVTALGPGVGGPAVGTRVAAFVGAGGLAEAANVPAARCVPLPEAMALDVAAGFLVAYGTSHLALTRKAAVQPGETLLVLGAAGGVGLTAVEIGKALGARVIAAARGAEKCAVAQAAGADHLIDTGTADLRAEVKALGGANVVYDPVGGDLFQAAFRSCRPEARILVIGFASGDIPRVPANHLLVKNLSVIGYYWGGFLKFAPEVLMESLATCLSWYAEGRLRPHISHRLPLAQAAQGLELLRHRKSTGKVVITMD